MFDPSNKTVVQYSSCNNVFMKFSCSYKIALCFIRNEVSFETRFPVNRCNYLVYALTRNELHSVSKLDLCTLHTQGCISC